MKLVGPPAAATEAVAGVVPQWPPVPNCCQLLVEDSGDSIALCMEGLLGTDCELGDTTVRGKEEVVKLTNQRWL